MRAINRVAVLGSGVMGGAIAAHLTNCGVDALMLDILPPGETSDDPAKRNALAAKSIATMRKAKPAPAYVASNLDRIAIGNFEDDMAKIADCDWIVEAVKEDLSIKKKVYAEVAKHRTPGTIVSSNTSGIPIHSMAEAMDDEMSQHFLGTHFFNPPRYLKLVELIPGPKTLGEISCFMAGFLENTLGKGVVYAKDSPNFVANRILTFSSQFILHEMVKDGLSVEEVDAVTGPAVGHASSATFRTFDLVGLDTYVNVVGNVANNCPDDERRDVLEIPDFVQKMVDKGMIGEKSGSGFYKKTDRRDEKGKRIILGLDFETLEYREPIKPRFECTGAARKLEDLDEKIKVMHTGDDKGSQFAWKVFAHSAIYAANRIPEAVDDIVNIDNAVKWGFAWDIGIFETWDVLGFEDVCQRMESGGLQLPPIVHAMREAGATSFYLRENGQQKFFDVATKSYQPVPENPNVFSIAAAKAADKVVKKNASCTLIDLGDGILCAEFHTKMNTIDADMGNMLRKALGMLNEGAFEGMVLGNQGDHFCAGANIFVVLGEAMQGNWGKVEAASNDFQQLNMAMRFCTRPIVSAPHHYTFGGGVEMCQHTAKSLIAGETYAGLVEAGVGLVPGGGGCKEMLRRAQAFTPPGVPDPDPMPYWRRAFESIAMAKVGTSGPEAFALGYFEPSNPVTPNFDQQIKRAKDLCRGLVVAGYQPPKPAQLTALGEPARALAKMAVYNMRLGGFASEHDALIAEKIGYILSGGDRAPGTTMTEQDVLDLEREAFVSLCGTEKTRKRIQHMLQTGKPLRN